MNGMAQRNVYSIHFLNGGSLFQNLEERVGKDFNEKHSHKVLVVFDGTDLCYFGTAAMNATNVPSKYPAT